MKKLLIIALLFVGCSIEPLNDILGVISPPDGYQCSIYGYAKISTMINETSSYEDSLTVLLSTKIGGEKNQATTNCEDWYNSVEMEYLMADSLGMFDSCYCEKIIDDN